MSAALYELNGIERREAGRVLLSMPALEISEGGITAVVGPNGAGKSLLLRVLALLDAPQAGTLRVNGGPVVRKGAALTEQRRSVTLVGQTPYLFQGTVFDNVSLGLKLRGVPRADWSGRVARALERVELSGFEKQRARSLSGGEARRIAIARALVIETPVLLLDEPFANLDQQRVERLEWLVRELNREHGATVIFSTHDLTQAHALGGRVIQLAGGRIVSERHDNLFSGSVEREDSGSFLRLDGGTRLVLPAEFSGAVTCTVDPDAIEVRRPDDSPGSEENRIAGRIQRMEIRGDRARLRVEAGPLFRIELPLEQARERGLTLGQEVVLCFPAAAVRQV